MFDISFLEFGSNFTVLTFDIILYEAHLKAAPVL